MLHIPDDLRDTHRLQSMPQGCVVAYATLRASGPTPVLATDLTIVHVRAGTKHVRSPHHPEGLEVQVGQVLVFAPGLRVMSELLSDGGRYESTLVCLTPDALQDLQTPPPNETPPVVTSFDPDPYLTGLLEELPARLGAARDPRLLELKLRELCLALSSTPAGPMLAHEAAVGGPSQGEHRLRSVMSRHALEPIGLQEYARLYGRSLASFKRDFRRAFDTSPGRWLVHTRLEHARTLLLDADVNVTQACLASGFGDLSHFVRSFRQAYGITPKRYQREAHAAPQ